MFGFLSALVLTGSLQISPPLDPAASAASDVLTRILGRRGRQFKFRSIQADGERCTVKAHGGVVELAGTSSVAMCRGAYEYLKTKCHCQVSWSGDNLKLPATLPDSALFEVKTSNRFRSYFNVCTFGYTTVWWDWKRWQHEIDWMALHGINMPLALNGQEAIWQKLFLSLGIPQTSIDKFFTGPAFLPWHRMGNLDQHMGPLSERWLQGQAQLQKLILGRERELGMTPVVPGFSGFVPADFQKFFPNAKLDSPTAWAGFVPTKFLSPLDPMFVQIGTRFIEDYNREYGSSHYYLCDTFNEMNPQFPKEEEMQDLQATGRAVYNSIHAADPDGVWVTQGWLFYSSKDYWTHERATALLGTVPKASLWSLTWPITNMRCGENSCGPGTADGSSTPCTLRAEHQPVWRFARILGCSSKGRLRPEPWPHAWNGFDSRRHRPESCCL